MEDEQTSEQQRKGQAQHTLQEARKRLKTLKPTLKAADEQVKTGAARTKVGTEVICLHWECAECLELCKLLYTPAPGSARPESCWSMRAAQVHGCLCEQRSCTAGGVEHA